MTVMIVGAADGLWVNLAHLVSAERQEDGSLLLQMSDGGSLKLNDVAAAEFISLLSDLDAGVANARLLGRL